MKKQIFHILLLATVFSVVCQVFTQTSTPTPLQNLKQDKKAKADALYDEGLDLFKQGTAASYQTALERLYQASLLYAEIEDYSEKRGLSLLGIGSTFYRLRENTSARKFYEQALNFFQVHGYKKWEGLALNEIGNVCHLSGEEEKALEFYNRALSIFREVVDKSGEALSLGNLGNVYSTLGERQKALNYFGQALPLFRQLVDKSNEGELLNRIGGVYQELGESQKSLEYYEQAYSLFRQVDNKAGQARTLNNIGLTYSYLGRIADALELFNKALPLFRQVGDKLGEANALSNIGDFSEKQKKLEAYNQVSLLFRQAGYRAGEVSILIKTGAAYDAIGDKQKALEYFNDALFISKANGIKPQQMFALVWLAYYWNTLKNPRFSIFYGKQVVNLLQELRMNIQGLDKEVQKSYLKSVEKTYRKLAEILVTEERIQEAQQVLNSFKDQQFFDFNQAQVIEPKLLALAPREKDFITRYERAISDVGSIGSRLDELKRKVGNGYPAPGETEQINKLKAQLKTATDAFNAVQGQAETEFSKPADEKDKVADISDAHEMQAALKALNKQTGQKAVAVYTLLGEDKFVALIVSPDGMKAVFSPVSGAELNNKARKLWGLLQSDAYDTTVLSKHIYDSVFKPIEAELPADTTTIMWSLDGNLRYIPMGALWDGKQFLAERYNHVIFTRADAERMTRNLSPNWTASGFGTTEPHTVELLGSKLSFGALPGVTKELGEIFKQKNPSSGILQGEVLSDADFTRENFTKSAKLHRPVVHIASHFSFRPGDEARSFLLMGDGTAFTLNDMKKEADLFQGVDLLTLSACNTAATQHDANGREIDGFAELAQRLGAGAVMATLWSVSDASTPWLMRDFYANKLNNKITKAEALRKAQLALLGGTAQTEPLPHAEKGAEDKVQVVVVPDANSRDDDGRRSELIYVSQKDAPLYRKEGKPKFAHPFYWSPFVLIGNWK